MIDTPSPANNDDASGGSEAHAAYYEKRATAFLGLADHCARLGYLGSWRAWLRLALEAREHARRIRALLTSASADSPLPDYSTFPPAEERPLVIASPAAHLGRRLRLETSIDQVACWMRDSWPEAWYYAPMCDRSGAPGLLDTARRLILIRDRYEAGRYQP